MDIAKIKELIEVLEASSTEQLCVRKGDLSVCVKKRSVPDASRLLPEPVSGASQVLESSVSGASHRAPDQEPEEEAPAEGRWIRAPMVGIFHSIDGIAREGAHISAGQVVGAIESMKLLNDVVSDVSGVVRETMVDDGTPVEYGQPLCRVEPD